MTKLKENSKLNKEVEACIKAIKKLPYSKQALYKATRRYNDRILSAKAKAKAKPKSKKCLKKPKSTK